MNDHPTCFEVKIDPSAKPGNALRPLSQLLHQLAQRQRQAKQPKVAS
jgi:hypothetical protein